MSKKSGRLTTAAGIPVPDNQTSLTAGARGLRESSFAIGALHLNKYQLLMLANVIAYLWPHLLRRRLRTEGEAGTVEVISFMAQSLRGAIAPFMRIGNGDKDNPEKHQESKNER